MKGRVEWHVARMSSQVEFDVRVVGPRRWRRLAVFVGSSPGSHRWLWRTVIDDLAGWNLRVPLARRWRCCLTVLAHGRATRPVTER